MRTTRKRGMSWFFIFSPSLPTSPYLYHHFYSSKKIVWNQQWDANSCVYMDVLKDRICGYLRLTLGKAMASDSSTLAWKIPWTEEPGRLQSMGSQRVGHDWATSLFTIDQKQVTVLCTLKRRSLHMGWIPGSVNHSEKLSDLLKITQPARGRARIWIWELSWV